MNIEDFKNRQWELFGAPCTPYIADAFARGPARGFIPVFGMSCEVLCLSRGSYLEWLYDRSQVIAFSESLLPSILLDPWGQYARCRAVAEEFSAVHDALMVKDLSSLSDAELHDVMEGYLRIFERQFAVNNLIEPISFYFQTRFRGMLLAEGVVESDVNILMDIFGRSKYPNYVKQCLEEYARAETADEVQSLLKKYAYLANDYLGPKPLTESYIEELQKHQSHESDARPSVDLSSRAEQLLEVFQLIATIQDVRKQESLMMISGAYFFAEEYAKRLGIAPDVIQYALWEEILDGSVDENRLRSRMEQCAIFWRKDRTEIFEGAEGLALAESLRESIYGKSEEAMEIQGICASPGTVRGRAVVVMDTSEFDTVETGDILFTMMTRPEYLIVMQRAAAFVTDEGGITSHAAIVAREMKKPCIIATKTGTKTVRTGDLVEVDAESGVVRIINKK